MRVWRWLMLLTSMSRFQPVLLRIAVGLGSLAVLFSDLGLALHDGLNDIVETKDQEVAQTNAKRNQDVIHSSHLLTVKVPLSSPRSQKYYTTFYAILQLVYLCAQSGRYSRLGSFVDSLDGNLLRYKR